VQAQAPVADTDAEARGVFEAGRAAYAAGRYEDALQYFQRAYELSGRSQLLYNVGQAADRLRQDERALDAFKRYLAETPNPGNREEVETRIQILEGVVADKRAKEAAAVPSPAEVAAAAPSTQPAADSEAATASDADGPITSKWWFWTGAGVIVTGIVVGVVIAATGGDDAIPVTNGTDGMVIEALSAAR